VTQPDGPQQLSTLLVTHVYAPGDTGWSWVAVVRGSLMLTEQPTFTDAITGKGRPVPGIWVQFAGLDGTLYGFFSAPGQPWVKWALPAPAVSGIDPAGGPAATVVTVTGSGFTAAQAVLFGTAPAESFTVTSDTSLTAVAPDGLAPGVAVDITVTGPGGTSPVVPADQFTGQ